MTERELVIPLSELDRVEIICLHEGCSGTVTLNLAAALGSTKDGEETSRCPVCKNQIIAPMLKIQEAWQAFVSRVGDGKIQFRIKDPDLKNTSRRSNP